jgi:hypothetical protein
MKRLQNIAEKGRVKFRFLEFELDGSDTTLQESLKSIAAAISRTSSGPKLITSSGKNEKEETEEVEGSDLDEAPAQDSTSVDESQNRVTPSKPASTPRTPKVLPDMDLKKGSISLEDFCKKKNPTGDQQKYLVIAHWLKENLNIIEVSMDHVHTCYRTMGWHTPKDASGPLRSMKRSGWFQKGKEKGTYAINHVGDNEVSKMNS